MAFLPSNNDDDPPGGIDEVDEVDEVDEGDPATHEDALPGWATRPEASFRSGPPENIEGQEAFVLYFDILGFKQLMGNSPRLAKRYRAVMKRQRLAAFMEAALPDAGGVKRTGFFKVNHIVVFSDSGFIFMADASEQAFREICALANLIFRDCLRNELPIRGAIASGQLWSYPAEGVFLGQAISRAHALAEVIEGIGVVTLEERWPDATSGPCLAAMRGGGGLHVRVPAFSLIGGLASASEGLRETWIRMRDAAIQSGDPRALSKYDSSPEVVLKLLEP